jgi:hypothetical protein
MRTRTVQLTGHIENTPEAVTAYIADVRNRPLYLPSLKAVSDIQGDPAAAGTTWTWTWVAPGFEFEGIARCLAYEPGRLYSFKSEGGIESTWTYRVKPEGDGTRLDLEVDYTLPERALPRITSESVVAGLEKSEAERAIQNLKTILDR